MSKGRPLPTTGSDSQSPSTPPLETAGPPSEFALAAEPIRIVGIVKEGVGSPRSDGSPGSALYRVPLRLSRSPSVRWGQIFVEVWNHPPSYTTMHRPGIASVSGDTIVLDGTTLDELEKYHAQTLKLCVAKANEYEEELVRKENAHEEARKRAAEEHRRQIEDASDRIEWGE
jgi:hypothetical protein